MEDVMRGWAAGSFLEVGSGTGYMTQKLLQRGMHGACYELGEEARSQLRKNLDSFGNNILVLDSLDELEGKSFDYLFAFEVLEHIDGDGDALSKWASFIKRGGKVLISVPAHQKKYGKSDEIVGHVRRYERDQMEELLHGAGFGDIKIINYGFPISELTRPISNLMIKESSEKQLPMIERSTNSSMKRQSHIQWVIDTVGENVFLPFKEVQRWFYRFDWGDGLMVCATKL